MQAHLEALHQVGARVRVAEHKAAEVAHLLHAARIRQQRRQLRTQTLKLLEPLKP